MNNRNIPYSLEAEQSVLGSAFLSKGALQKICDELTTEDFYLESHQKIFDVLKDLNSEGMPVDITILTDRLENAKELSSVGNLEYLVEIANFVPSASNVDYYIKIVHDKALRRRLIDASNEISNVSYTSDGEVNDIIDEAEKKIFSIVQERKTNEFRDIKDVVFKAQNDLEKLSESKHEITGLSTGFYDFDKLTSGLHENELMILAARPGMGKTAFALNIASFVARNTSKNVAIFNYEMSAEQLVNRMFSSIGQINFGKFRSGSFDNEDWKKLNESISVLSDTKIKIDDTTGSTISDIRSKCRKLAASDDGLALVVIDYLQLINGSGKNANNRQQEVAEISRGLKMMAMELHVPVIALAQLSRSVEARPDKKPMMSDLRESGSIEQDADMVAFVHRDDYYNHELALANEVTECELIIGKNRNGPAKSIPLLFKGNTVTFFNFQKESNE